MNLRVAASKVCSLLLCMSTAVFAPGSACAAAESLRLWPTRAPLSSADTPADVPSIDVYRPRSNPTHTGVLICPGGGYGYLSLDHEGSRIAQWLTQHGVAAFVLHYRVAPYRYPAAQLDAHRALRLIRSRANHFAVSANHIGVWGFSAGGHLASTLMTHFADGHSETPTMKPGTAARGSIDHDAIDDVSDRPDFGILAYAVILMTPGIAHVGSHDRLLGNPASKNLENELSNERHVRSDSPPAFIFATTDDAKVPVANSILFYQAYVANRLPVAMHLYEHGEHGVGLADSIPGVAAWPGLLASWMRIHGWMGNDQAAPGQ